MLHAYFLNVFAIIFMKPIKPTRWLFLALLGTISSAYAQDDKPSPLQKMGSIADKTAASLDSLIREAEALIENGKPAAAYTLLAPLEFQRAGEIRFDFLLGVAALESGQPDKATYILERVLSVKPDFAPGRLAMGRAYYQLGDLPRARTEFAAVLSQNPPPDIRGDAHKYLEAVNERPSGQGTQFSCHLEATLGRDSNVNSSTDQRQIFVDLYSLNTTLQASSIMKPDNYFAAAAGGEIRHSLNDRWEIFADINLRKRDYQIETPSDSVSVEMRAGVVRATLSDRVRFSAQGGQFHVGGSRNSGTIGLRAEWRHIFSAADRFDVVVQQMQYRYNGIEMQQNDFDQQFIALGWQHILADGLSSLSGSIHSGSEQDVSIVAAPPTSPDGGRADGAKRFRGIRIGGQHVFVENTTLFASVGGQAGEYEKINYYFLRQRRDRLYDLILGMNWHWDSQWTLRPQLSYTRNDSNIVIYRYNRSDISLTLRRDFR